MWSIETYITAAAILAVLAYWTCFGLSGWIELHRRRRHEKRFGPPV